MDFGPRGEDKIVPKCVGTSKLRGASKKIAKRVSECRLLGRICSVRAVHSRNQEDGFNVGQSVGS